MHPYRTGHRLFLLVKTLTREYQDLDQGIHLVRVRASITNITVIIATHTRSMHACTRVAYHIPILVACVGPCMHALQRVACGCVGRACMHYSGLQVAAWAVHACTTAGYHTNLPYHCPCMALLGPPSPSVSCKHMHACIRATCPSQACTH